VRDDRAVPAFLRHEAPERTVRALAFLEVVAGEESPQAYAAGFGAPALPFDYVVFTARTERGDPCEGLRHRKRETPAPPGSVWVRR
jgi:hypothetical protein